MRSGVQSQWPNVAYVTITLIKGRKSIKVKERIVGLDSGDVVDR